MKKVILRPITIAMALAASAAVYAGDAQAAPVIQTFTCSQGIAQIVWDGGALFIDCVGEPNRFAVYSFNPCSGVFGSFDTVKIDETLATSAFLSGHTLIMSYATPASCVGGNVGAITALTIQP